MIPNPILYNDNTIMIGVIACCLIVLAVVMIHKAIKHRKQMKQNESEKPVLDEEQEVQMIVIPNDENKKLSYKEKFIYRNEIKKRDCVYISHDTHSKIMKLTKALDNITIGGYVDTVLREHLKEYKDEINNIYSESRKDLL
jgi:Zn-dependent metalloprotease